MSVIAFVAATTILHQTVTTKMEGKPDAREQAVVTAVDGERFRIERYPGKDEKGEWVALVVFDGKQTFNCRRGKQNTCRATSGGPLSELDAFLGQPGLKVQVQSFSFVSAGEKKKIAGESCQPHDMNMQVSAEIDLGGMKLPGGFKPAIQATIKGHSCIAQLTDWKPAALVSQLASAKSFFVNTAAYDSFIAAAKSGAGFELEGDTTLKSDLGGGASGLPNTNSTSTKTTSKVETGKPALKTEQLKVPPGFAMIKAK